MLQTVICISISNMKDTNMYLILAQETNRDFTEQGTCKTMLLMPKYFCYIEPVQVVTCQKAYSLSIDMQWMICGAFTIALNQVLRTADLQQRTLTTLHYRYLSYTLYDVDSLTLFSVSLQDVEINMDYDICATQSEALLCCLSPPSVEYFVYMLNHHLLS